MKTEALHGKVTLVEQLKTLARQHEQVRPASAPWAVEALGAWQQLRGGTQRGAAAPVEVAARTARRNSHATLRTSGNTLANCIT